MISAEHMCALPAFFADIPDPRRAQGRRHPLPAVLAIATAAVLCGARGYSRDTLLEWMYRYARQAQLVDGASEVHKMVMSRFFIEEGRDFWSWDA